MNVSSTHSFPVGKETFWKSIYFDEEYNKALFLTQIGAKSYEVLELKETDREIRRRVRVVPKQNAPAILAKFAKEDFSYVEEGTFSKEEGVYRFAIIPSMMPDKMKVAGKVTVAAAGDKRVTRTIDLDLKASVFGLGGQIEKFVGEQIQRGYEDSYQFTLDWIKNRSL